MGSTLSREEEGVLQSFTPLLGTSEKRIVFIGLDGAGKTTLLKSFNLGEPTVIIPTVGLNIESVKFRNITFTALDLGYADKIRPIFRHFLKDTDGLVFVMDSSDRERLYEARDELEWVLHSGYVDPRCLLVLANKQEVPHAICIDEISDKLRLKAIKKFKWHIQASSVTSGEGLKEGFEWLANNISGLVNSLNVQVDTIKANVPLEFDENEVRIPVVGLYGSGKTTILSKLNAGQLDHRVPVIGIHFEIIKYMNVTFIGSDILHHSREQCCRILKKSVGNPKGMVFVVDSCDPRILDDASCELKWMLDSRNLGATVVLILANKQEIRQCMTLTEITERLGLRTIPKLKWHVQATCAKSGEGLKEGFEWMLNTISGKSSSKDQESTLTKKDEDGRHTDTHQKESEYESIVRDVNDGNNIAKTKLAWYLLCGRGGAKVDKEKAFELLKERVKENNDDAMWMLGVCYEFGISCEEDLNKAVSLYSQSSDCGNTIGAFLVNNQSGRGSRVMKVNVLSDEMKKRFFEVFYFAPWSELDLREISLGKEVFAIGEGLKNNTTLTTLSMSLLEEGTREFCEGLMNNTTLTSLNLKGKCIGCDGVRVAHTLECNHSLTRLNLSMNNLGFRGGESIGEALKTNSSLTTLNLRGCYVLENGARGIGEGLGVNNTLTALNLRENNIRPEGAQMIAEGLLTNSTLVELNLSCNHIGEEGGFMIAQTLCVNSSLMLLNLTKNDIGTYGGKMISEALKKNNTLTTLYLGNNDIGAEGTLSISEALEVNTSLATLCLEENQIGTGVKFLFESLENNTTLTALDLGFNNIGLEGGRKTAELLKSNTTLTTLFLGGNSIGNEGVIELSESLIINPTLTKLSLNDNRIGQEGAQKLSEYLKINTTLTALDLMNNFLGDEGLGALSKALLVNSSLIELNLSWNEVGDDGAIKIGEALTNNSTLTRLDMNAYRISEKTKRELGL